MSVHLQTKWLWFCVQLQWLKHHILHLLRARSSLTFRQLWSVDSLWNAYMIWQEHTVTWNYLFIHTYYYWNNKHGNAKENASCASSRIHQLSIFKIWGQKLEVLLSIFCGTKINKFFHPLPIIQYFEIFIPAICNFGRGGVKLCILCCAIDIWSFCTFPDILMIKQTCDINIIYIYILLLED